MATCDEIEEALACMQCCNALETHLEYCEPDCVECSGPTGAPDTASRPADATTGWLRAALRWW